MGSVNTHHAIISVLLKSTIFSASSLYFTLFFYYLFTISIVFSIFLAIYLYLYENIVLTLFDLEAYNDRVNGIHYINPVFWEVSMNTKKVCSQLQITQKLLRTYEEQGVITPKRLGNNYRDYSVEDIVTIKCTMLLRELGFSYEQVRTILTETINSSHQLEQIFYIHLKTIEYKIRELETIKSSLKKCINDFLGKNESSATDLVNIINFKSNIGEFDEEFAEFIWDFDDLAVSYDENVILKTADHQKALHILKDYIRTNYSTCFAKILDVGCGSCYLWHDMEDLNVTALDNSPQMLFFAQKKLPWIQFLLADILEYDPPETMRFHLVCSSFLLHHIPSKYHYTAVINMLSMLDEHGQLVLVDRMFYDKNDEIELRDYYIQNGEFRKVADMESEYFPYVNQLHTYFDSSGYHVNCQNIVKGIWMITVTL